MIGFSYTYSTPENIFSGLAGSDIFLSIVAGALVVVCVFFIFPSLLIFSNSLRENALKKQKKRMLNQILIQKEIENEIEEEIKLDGKGVHA